MVLEKGFIPYGRQLVDEEDIRAVADVLRSAWLTTGPVVERFERVLAARAGARFCVAFSSGTAALHGAYFAAGVGQGDEVVTTSLTFTATANAALYLGARPVFVDIGHNSFNINVEKIEKAITPRTRVIAPVDMGGMPADLDEIMVLAKRHNLTVVEDGCHALGALYRGRPVGSIADLTVFSFHPVKHITCGEGGAVTTDDEKFYQRLLLFRNHGVVRDADQFTGSFFNEGKEPGPWYYEQQFLGFNYRLPDINCALGLSQFKKLDMFLQRRREIAALYCQAFAEYPLLVLPPRPKDEETVSAWHLFILQLKGESPPRREVVTKLHDMGIGTQVHYLPVYLHPYYRDLGYQLGLCPQAEDYYRRAFSIPLFPAMTGEDVGRVIEGVPLAVELCLGKASTPY